jgi:hypothetical protein
VNSSNEKLIIIFFEETIEIKDTDEFKKQEEKDNLFFQMDHSIIQHIKDLEQELFQAKESLQTTIEEFQASNEELIVGLKPCLMAGISL